MKKNKIVVYTCITGNYDNLKEIDKKLLENDITYYCFTNNKNIKSNTWKVIYIEDFNLSNHMLNRKIKILGHELINDNFDVSVWLDGNISIRKKISTFLNEECHLDNFSLCAFKHPKRNCIYDEGVECVKLKKDSKDVIVKQLKFYEENSYPKNNGLCEMNIIVREINDSCVIKTMQLWYEMINKYSKRDQLSFMWCVSKTNLKLEILPQSNNKYFIRSPHYIKETAIDDYRLYFGNSDDFEIENVVDGKYMRENDIYKINNVKVPVDSNRLEFYVCNVSGVEFNSFKINTNTTAITIYNYTIINSKKYFFNNSSKIVVNGDFKKNDIISISIMLKIISLDEWITIAHDEYEENINLKDKLNEITKQIEIKNNENKIYKHRIQSMENSKGWKYLEKIRKLLYRMK